MMPLSFKKEATPPITIITVIRIVLQGKFVGGLATVKLTVFSSIVTMCNPGLNSSTRARIAARALWQLQRMSRRIVVMDFNTHFIVDHVQWFGDRIGELHIEIPI